MSHLVSSPQTIVTVVGTLAYTINLQIKKWVGVPVVIDHNIICMCVYYYI